MKLKFLFSFLLLLSCRLSFAGNYVFDYNQRCHTAYLDYMSLNFDKGRAIIIQELRSNPYNLMATYLADYEDCLLLLMNGSKKDYEQLNDHLDERLKLIANGDENSPWFRLCKAELYFHWALVNIRFGSNLKAATTFRKSFLLLKENQKRFPQFKQNNIFMGLEEAVIGTIPDEYKWLASIFGMKGNVKNGIHKIENFIKSTPTDEPLREEAILYSVYLKYYLSSQQQEEWNFINSSEFPTDNNLFHSFIKSNIAINFRQGDIAIAELKKAEKDKNYARFPILDYEMACALLNKLDKNAQFYFQRFLSNYQGRFFVKESWQKLAYCYYLQGDMNNAEKARASIFNHGTTNVDADKQAQRFAESNTWPSKPILEMRLLIDGGYYNEALQKIKACNINNLSSTDKLEYYFRLARVYDELKNEKLAFQYYRTTINLGRTKKEHYAARAALQMGMIHEREGNNKAAIADYTECLEMKGHDFQSNIDQQAKAGINRLTPQ